MASFCSAVPPHTLRSLQPSAVHSLLMAPFRNVTRAGVRTCCRTSSVCCSISLYGTYQFSFPRRPLQHAIFPLISLRCSFHSSRRRSRVATRNTHGQLCSINQILWKTIPCATLLLCILTAHSLTYLLGFISRNIGKFSLIDFCCCCFYCYGHSMTIVSRTT